MYDIIQLLKKLNEGATVLKKVVTFFGMLLTMLLACPTGVWAAGEDTTAQVPVWLCIPYAGLLHCNHAADQSRRVGGTSAACGTYVDRTDDHSFCGCLWSR